jgi:hypothetical protein
VISSPSIIRIFGFFDGSAASVPIGQSYVFH